MKQGDLVVRKSYGGDLLFRVAAFADRQAILRGMDYRLLADSPLGDLQPVRNPEEWHAGTRAVRLHATESLKRMSEELARKNRTEHTTHGMAVDHRQAYFEYPGKVLHLDGDANYLNKSMQVYQQLRIPASGLHCHESQMPRALADLLPQHHPDIVVITGHDGVLKHKTDLQQLSSYKNSLNFVRAIQVAREYERSKDAVIVVAGACQSHFEALLHAGANFASSPGRIMIHALDPVYIAARAAYTPFREMINLGDVVAHTISGTKGVGGIETMGRYRRGMPNLKWVMETSTTASGG